MDKKKSFNLPPARTSTSQSADPDILQRLKTTGLTAGELMQMKGYSDKRAREILRKSCETLAEQGLRPFFLRDGEGQRYMMLPPDEIPAARKEALNLGYTVVERVPKKVRAVIDKQAK